MDSSYDCPSFMEDQAVEIVGQIGQCRFGVRSGRADRSDEQTIAVLLVCEHMLDRSTNG